jgi:hypothetical protein
LLWIIRIGKAGMMKRLKGSCTAFSHPQTAPLTSLIILYFMASVQAFMPYDWREASFGAGGVSHKAMTRNAYKALATEFFPEIEKLSSTMIAARDLWALANALVDNDQSHAAPHFDGESFPQGQFLLVGAGGEPGLKQKVIQSLKDGRAGDARIQLGQALHTL